MHKRQPDFSNLLKILRQKKPDRPTLFEFFLNRDLYELLADEKAKNRRDKLRDLCVVISACKNAGYDYATIPTSYTQTLKFQKKATAEKQSKSLNEGFVINDEQSFENYAWPNPEEGNYKIYEQLEKELPDGMKLVACGPGGVLENAIELVGYENLCFMSLANEELTRRVFDAIGSRLLQYYKIVASFSSVGALISNDDWGFKTQTLFSPEMLRRYVFPWHKKITDAIHNHHKPAILHSCGNRSEIMDDIIDDMQYDALHSFEDSISPVETEWHKYHKRIAILGGIDMNFLSRSTPEKIKYRARNLLELTAEEGSYALGSGNSIAAYVPVKNFRAMIETAHMNK
uniref:uroporphyrinogen decarboxylase family protein n=1 Tax=uncultured Draconibacterium sp. TaxID=1573823 RepID=UPI0032176B31